MAEDFLPEDFMPDQIRAEYRKSALLENIIYPYIEKKENGYVVVLADENKNPYAIVEATKRRK